MIQMTELNGMPIIITTRFRQKRKHRKKRINKKWKKKYGVVEYNPMPEGKIFICDGIMFMSRKDYYLVKQALAMRGYSDDSN